MCNCVYVNFAFNLQVNWFSAEVPPEEASTLGCCFQRGFGLLWTENSRSPSLGAALSVTCAFPCLLSVLSASTYRSPCGVGWMSDCIKISVPLLKGTCGDFFAVGAMPSSSPQCKLFAWAASCLAGETGVMHLLDCFVLSLQAISWVYFQALQLFFPQARSRQKHNLARLSLLTVSKLLQGCSACLFSADLL